MAHREDLVLSGEVPNEGGVGVMWEIAKGLLGSEAWQARAKEINRKVELAEVECPYEAESDDNCGLVKLKFTDPTAIKTSLYTWDTPGVTHHTISISPMPDGCGVLVVSGLWGFGDSGYDEAKFMMDFVVDLGRYMANSRSYQIDDHWGRMLLATTSNEQKSANRYFKESEWTKVGTTRNPRTGNTMYVWMKHLTKSEGFPKFEMEEEEVY